VSGFWVQGVDLPRTSTPWAQAAIFARALLTGAADHAVARNYTHRNLSAIQPCERSGNSPAENVPIFPKFCGSMAITQRLLSDRKCWIQRACQRLALTAVLTPTTLVPHRRMGEDRYHSVERRGMTVVDHALAWLNQHPRGPFFLWVHFYDPHDPYAPPPPFKIRYAASPYDGEIAYVDSAVGKLLMGLRRAVFTNRASHCRRKRTMARHLENTANRAMGCSFTTKPCSPPID